ncbi:MAG: alpha/beta fold hydrolase [Alphaproteobacteria bacterium]|nr:alpha/beta fold hydrolase [Alphaproteobacteria bacterium]
MPRLDAILLRLIRNAALFVVVSYVAVTAAMFLLQSRFIYVPDSPSREVVATPEQIGLAYERVQFTTEDGVQLDGWFVPAEQLRGVLLFFHGNAGNISHRLESLRIFNRLGLSTFIFDYRGYGRSTGKPSEQGTYLDAAAAWRYLTVIRGIPESQIVSFGRSLGSSIAAHQAMQATPKALILESPFTPVPDIGARAYPFLPVRWLARYQYDTRKYLKTVAAPVLILHSPQDEVIPYVFGLELLEIANDPKKFVKLAGGHNDGFLVSGRTYIDGLDAFLKTHFDQ